jgi:hypothetical protein
MNVMNVTTYILIHLYTNKLLNEYRLLSLSWMHILVFSAIGQGNTHCSS